MRFVAKTSCPRRTGSRETWTSSRSPPSATLAIASLMALLPTSIAAIVGDIGQNEQRWILTPDLRAAQHKFFATNLGVESIVTEPLQNGGLPINGGTIVPGDPGTVLVLGNT